MVPVNQNYLEFKSTLWLSISALSIIVTIIATVNFCFWWTIDLQPGAHYWAVILVNILLGFLLASIPLIYILHPSSLLSKLYLTIPTLIAIWIMAGFLFLLDLFIPHASPYLPAFLLDLIIFVPIIGKTGEVRKTRQVEKI